jgi:hypothetical protein
VELSLLKWWKWKFKSTTQKYTTHSQAGINKR